MTIDIPLSPCILILFSSTPISLAFTISTCHNISAFPLISRDFFSPAPGSIPKFLTIRLVMAARTERFRLLQAVPRPSRLAEKDWGRAMDIGDIGVPLVYDFAMENAGLIQLQYDYRIFF